MSLVRLENISKYFAGTAVLDGVDFRVEAGEKIGLIGRNGTGKTTLFRLITGETEPDSGTIERMRSARIACLAQIPQINPEDTIHKIALHSFDALIERENELVHLEHVIAAGDESVMEKYGMLQDAFSLHGGYEYRTKINQILCGLGFHRDDFGLHFKALSGGQRTRLMLALVLLQEADLLLLDEPENHLDVAAREWLEEFLKKWPKAVVIISHDRHILNVAVDRIVEIERGVFTYFAGNYDAYLEHKALLLEQQQKAYDQQQEFMEKQISWINRFRYKNTKAKLVQSRVRAMEKLERIEAPTASLKMPTFKMDSVVRSGQVVLDAKELTMRYDNLLLYENLSFALLRNERLGIIGPNGSGKTTLLRQLAGHLPQAVGTVTAGHKVRLGFYDQHHQSLNPNNDILSEIRHMKEDWPTDRLRRFLGRFLFVGDDVMKTISTLSGGELSRVALAKLILSDANLLLLDEPTNHLDIISREALEMALESFQGSIIIVSHDRTLIDTLVDKILIIENGHAELHLGNYSRYRWECEQAKIGNKTERPSQKSKHSIDRSQEYELRRKRQRLEVVEQCILKTEEQIQQLEHQFGELNPADYEAADRMKADYENLKSELNNLYEEWENLSESMTDEP